MSRPAPETQAPDRVPTRKNVLAPEKGLTDMELRFCSEYIIDFNGRQALMRAGNSKSPAAASAYASKLLAKPAVIEELRRLRQITEAKCSKTAQDVVEELVKLGFSNMADFVESAQTGDFTKMTREHMAAVQSLEMETEFVKVDEGHQGPPPMIRKVKLKLYDKRASLVDLGKHLGVFKENKDTTPQDFEFTVSIGTRVAPDGTAEAAAKVQVRPSVGVRETE